MPLPRYTYTGPIDHTIPANIKNVQGKSVIITGGANGMGKEFVFKYSGFQGQLAYLFQARHAYVPLLPPAHLSLSPI